MFYVIKVGTITNAQRACSALRYKGIKANITRLKSPQKEDGCGYVVQVVTDNIDSVISIIENEKIYIRGVDRA